MGLSVWWKVCILCFCCAVLQARSHEGPAIAMVCGKKTQHVNLGTGKWISDVKEGQDCMDSPDKILGYCQKMYPHLKIVHVDKENEEVRIERWCYLKHNGTSCHGHGHKVIPFRCVEKGSEETTTMLMKSTKPDLDPVCTQPKRIGLCRAAFDAWYFNERSMKCERFIYGGCGGNDNRFYIEEECRSKCEPGYKDQFEETTTADLPIYDLGFKDDLIIDPEPVYDDPEVVECYFYDRSGLRVWHVALVAVSACLVLALVVLGLAKCYCGRGRVQSAKFQKLEVEEKLTPEERQLILLQQNGYENPAYNFFEKQPLA